MDIRIGTITSAEPHELTRKPMYRLEVDLGPELGKRTIVAGIAAYYTKEQLVGKLVACIVNLDPKVIAGVESQGMLLAAEHDSVVSLLVPDREVAPGSAVG